ncbi:MAG: NADH-quinone oxidoreductase subunit J [Bacteroidetes bacterium]|jgi:NADH-quinone oxidoreductase subunit J|nr:NADH-quinone oxidoreductase subunit J [Bacteroidota bacterium]
MITQYLFYLLSFLALMFASMVVITKNPIHSVLYLVLTFFAIAGHYVLLNAQFLAAVHIIVYAGAIMVLFLFVIMLLNLNKETEPGKSIWLKASAVVASGLLLVVFVGAIKGATVIQSTNPFNANIGLIENLGMTLFNEFLLPFELASVLLLSAMVGAVMLGKKSIK